MAQGRERFRFMKCRFIIGGRELMATIQPAVVKDRTELPESISQAPMKS